MTSPLVCQDIEAWRRVERAIGDEALRLCGEACTDDKKPGKSYCRWCRADCDSNWRRDALSTLRRRAEA